MSTGLQACAIDPYCERGAGRCLFFLSPRMREGAERRKGASVTSWRLVRGAACSCDRARAPPGAPPRRFFTRPPHFLAWTGSIDLHVIRAALAPPFIQTRAAI